jgi:hypothetical protein
LPVVAKASSHVLTIGVSAQKASLVKVAIGARITSRRRGARRGDKTDAREHHSTPTKAE